MVDVGSQGTSREDGQAIGRFVVSQGTARPRQPTWHLQPLPIGSYFLLLRSTEYYELPYLKVRGTQRGTS